jgi:hypothetical protein
MEASAKDILATRRVIDVSGDGPNNDGNPMREAHDKTIAQGIVVNGLPIMDDNANGYYPNLDKYYAACVAGGPRVRDRGPQLQGFRRGDAAQADSGDFAG